MYRATMLKFGKPILLAKYSILIVSAYGVQQADSSSTLNLEPPFYL